MQGLEIIKLVWPLIVLQLAVQIYALVDIVKRGKTKNLNIPIWLVIIILGEIIGSLIYFLIGRADED